MKPHTIEDVAERVDLEGFEYALIYYADYSDVPDPEFQKLYSAFRNAHKALFEFLEPYMEEC